MLFFFMIRKTACTLLHQHAKLLKGKNCINTFKTCMISRNNKSQYMVYHAP